MKSNELVGGLLLPVFEGPADAALVLPAGGFTGAAAGAGLVFCFLAIFL